MDGHEFWSADVDCVSVAFCHDVQLSGHRQVTDAYLLLLARARSGCLATLDRRVGWLCPGTFDRIRIFGSWKPDRSAPNVAAMSLLTAVNPIRSKGADDGIRNVPSSEGSPAFS